MLEILLLALESLRYSLRDRGLDLLIKFGDAESVLRELVVQVKATHVFVEEEVEYELCLLMDDVSQTLSTLIRSPDLTIWRTPFYDIKSVEAIPESYDEFKKLQLPVTCPLSSPTLPCLEMELDWGTMPTLDALKEFMNSTRLNEPSDEWDSIKNTTAEAMVRAKFSKRGSNENNPSSREFRTERMGNSIFSTQRGKNFMMGGTEGVLNALAAYIRYNEGTSRDDWQALHEMVRNSESRDGASFIKLFGPAIHLGIVSKRKVHYEAVKYEKERNAGFLSPFGYSARTVAAAVDAVLSSEWYWLMGLKSKGRRLGSHSYRNWRWNGFLVQAPFQYTVVGCDGPAILLVHGFGAFLEHYRDNIHGIAEGGKQVWAVTMLGFGRSEKPNIVYSEQMWAEFLRDFIVEVVGRPVHLVGNSIGGYIVAIVACLWPALVESIVLINSAGSVIPGYSFLPLKKDRQVSIAAWLGARLLLSYLRLKTKDILKNCYPTRTDRADDWLVNEMLRASKDPGGLVLLESIFSFDLTVPLNYLLERLEGRVLIIQGMKDPIYNSKSLLGKLKEHCAWVMIKELNAGHCPHDELPEEVNSTLCEWIVRMEST
ncbi:Cryptochrome DASH [Cucumis melo var. makuwa]|uniref:Cryptochrome DASH n=1 Tax=Cucumis melo var. makuwa TaxID=1194695 RepID=A0A5D3DAV0_CUCMM|nr:Cryptochrome DASH [Cucumis melo var. makuwa]